MWVYKVKLNQDGEIQKHRTYKFIAKGFIKKLDIDFYEDFSLVVIMEII